MRLVIIESPYAGKTQAEIDNNVAYARACVRDSLARGEAPIASHLLYTQPGILRDEIPTERQWGIDAGLAWRSVAEASVVYTDFGISSGISLPSDNPLGGVWKPGVVTIPLYRMTDLPFGFKASAQDRREK